MSKDWVIPADTSDLRQDAGDTTPQAASKPITSAAQAKRALQDGARMDAADGGPKVKIASAAAAREAMIRRGRSR